MAVKKEISFEKNAQCLFYGEITVADLSVCVHAPADLIDENRNDILRMIFESGLNLISYSQGLLN